MNSIKIIDYDIIYLSYDEPNAEKNYADLCSKVPWAKRVHGVKGSDAAHKACAELSETDRFVTVDADNIIDPKFLEQVIDLSGYDDVDNLVFSWGGINQINGLAYGNGGLKLWSKSYVQNMRTHENSESDNKQTQVEFCWDNRYIQLESYFSKVYNNASPMQAWRAGFREGVKMCLDQGEKPSLEDFYKNYHINLHRLYIWSMVGADVDNGLYAILGAREGLYKTMCTDWDFVNVRDFDWLTSHWKNIGHEELNQLELLERVEELGVSLRIHLNVPIAVNPLDAGQSQFFKSVYRNTERLRSDRIIEVQFE